jgi:hypothetical protein
VELKVLVARRQVVEQPAQLLSAEREILVLVAGLVEPEVLSQAVRVELVKVFQQLPVEVEEDQDITEEAVVPGVLTLFILAPVEEEVLHLWQLRLWPQVPIVVLVHLRLLRVIVIMLAPLGLVVLVEQLEVTEQPEQLGALFSVGLVQLLQVCGILPM